MTNPHLRRFDDSYLQRKPSEYTREIMNNELSKWNKPDTFELDSQRYLLDNIIEDLKHRAILEAYKRYNPDKILWINHTEIEQKVVCQDTSGEKEINLTVKFEGEYQIEDNMSYWFWIYEVINTNTFFDIEVLNCACKKGITNPLLVSSPKPTDDDAFYPDTTQKRKVRKIVQTYKSKPILNELTGNYVYLELLSYKEVEE